jgi:hypothetical protein
MIAALSMMLVLSGAPRGPKPHKLSAEELATVVQQAGLDADSIDGEQAFANDALGAHSTFLAEIKDGIARYIVVRDGKIVFDVKSDRSQSFALPKVAAVVFKDLNRDGLMDILIVEHHEGNGGVKEDGTRDLLVYDEAVALLQQGGGAFIDGSTHFDWKKIYPAGDGRKPETFSAQGAARAFAAKVQRTK